MQLDSHTERIEEDMHTNEEAQPLYPENQFYFIYNSWNALQDKY